MADIARLGFSVDTSGLVRAERAIDSLSRAARGLRDISLRVDVSGAAEAMRQLDRLDGRNISARVTVDVSGAAEATRDLDRLSGGARSVRIDVGISGVEAAVRGLRDIERLAVNRTVRIDVDMGGVGGAIRDLERLAQQARDAAAEINGLGSNVNVTGGAFGNLGGIISTVMGAIGVGVIADATNDLIKYNAELNLLNSYLGVTREAMQVWGSAGKAVGVEIADVFKDVQEKIGEFAATGGGEAADVFKRLKLDVNDLIALSPDQQLLKIADAMSKITDMSMGEKSFLLESLGNDATRLLPLLDNNAAKLHELDEIMRNSGSIITDDQNAVLEEAYNNMTLLQAASEGATNALGMVGAEILNAFADDAVSAISGVGESIYTLIDEFYAVSDAWANTAGLMSDDSSAAADAIAGAFDWLMAGLAQGANELVELFRIGFTYLPNFAMAAFQAMIDYSMSWVHTAAAGFDAIKAAAGGAFASVVDFAGKAFGAVAGIAGQVVGYVIGRLADMASAVGGALSGMAAVPGMEGLSANVAGVEARLRGLAGTAKSSGAAVTNSFGAMAGSIRAAANESSASARISALQATTSKLSAQHALANASAMMVESEGNRRRTIEMGKAERQFARLGSGIDGAGAANKKYRVDQDAVNKAMEDGAGKAGKAAKAAKGKSDADKEAAKAARELEQAQKKITDAYDREYERLESQIIKYRDGEDALYKYKLTKDNLTDGMQATLIAMRDEAEALEEQHKAREKATKAAEKALESLDDEHAKLTLTADEYERYKLKVDGVVGAKQDEIIARKKAVDALDKESKAQKKAADDLVSVFEDAIMQGKNLFDGLHGWIENLFAELVLKPTLQPIADAAMSGGDVKGAAMSGLNKMWGDIKAGGMQGAMTSAGIAGGIVGLLGGSAGQQMGASIGAGIGNILLPGLGGVIGGALGTLAGGFLDDDDSQRAAFTGGNPKDGWRTGGGRNLYTTSKLGTFGFQEDGTHDWGAEGEKKLQAFVKQMAAVDNALVKFLPKAEIDRIKADLSNFKFEGTDFDKLFVERLKIISSGFEDSFAALIDFDASADEVLSRINDLFVMRDTLAPFLQTLNLQLGDTQEAALAATAGLADVAGGLQNLTAMNDYYLQNFYDEGERQQKIVEAARRRLESWNAEIGYSGDAMIDTREEFKRYIESLDLTTTAGQEAYVAAMGYANSIVSVTEAFNGAAIDMGDLIKTLGEAVPKERQATVEMLTGSGLPKYAVGTDYVKGDQAALIHNGEMIFSAGQSASLRDSVVAMARYASQPSSGGDNSETLKRLDALIAENKAIRTELAEFKAMNGQYSEISISQRSKQTQLAEKANSNAVFTSRAGSYA